MTNIKRKADISTESFRMWKTDETDKEKFKKEFKKEKEDGISVDLDGNVFVLQGFNIAYRKRDNKPLLAYKFKHEAKLILTWTAEDNNEEEIKLCEQMLSYINKGVDIGYEIIDSRKWIKTQLGSQLHLLDNKEKDL